MAWLKRKGIMLCQPLDEKKLVKNFKASPDGLLVQPKLDGMRAWVDWSSSHNPQLISSEGNLIEGVPHINLLLKDLARETRERLNFDGELYSHTVPFETIVGTAKRHLENLSDHYVEVEYHIFDFKSLADNQARVEKLESLFSSMPPAIKETGILKLVPTYKAKNEKEIMSYLSIFIKEGYEGIIIRNPCFSYCEKRPWHILKFKPTRTDIYEVVQVEEAISEKGEPLGRAGSILCQDRFGNKFSVGVGLGVTHNLAKSIWQDRNLWEGQNVKVSYQNLTERGVPRFGKFLNLEKTNEGENHV